MDLSVVVTRDLLSLPDLELNDTANGRVVMALGPGRREIDLHEVTSPVADGAVVVGQRAGMQTAFITVRVYATTPGGILAITDTIQQAFNQRQYFVTVTADDRTETWQCFSADTYVGASGRWQAAELAGGWQDITIEIPRLPDALAF